MDAMDEDLGDFDEDMPLLMDSGDDEDDIGGAPAGTEGGRAPRDPWMPHRWAFHASARNSFRVPLQNRRGDAAHAIQKTEAGRKWRILRSGQAIGRMPLR